MSGSAASRREIIWYWPNVIGYIRIFFLALAVSTFYKHAWGAAGFYTISEVLDALDGQAARLFNQSSLMGACLDQVTDRLSTLAIYLFLTSRFPEWTGLIFGLASIDIGGHWVYVHAQTLRGSKSHKEVPVHWPILNYYYTHRIFMFCCCVAYEVFLCSFLVCSFHIPGTFPYLAAKTLGIISVPLALFKIMTNAAQIFLGGNLLILEEQKR